MDAKMDYLKDLFAFFLIIFSQLIWNVEEGERLLLIADTTF